MTQPGTDRSPLRRMVARAPRAEADTQVTPTRALRIALTRAAERAAGLTATALGVSDDILPLSGLTGRVEDGWLFLRLDAPDASAPGLFAMDRGFLSAVTEMQMRGRLSPAEPEPRVLTAADAALAAPFAMAFLEELARAAAGTALDGWTEGRAFGGRFPDLRAIGLALPEQDFRCVGLSAWLGAGDRQGQVLLALPEVAPSDPAQDPAWRAALWSGALQDNVLAATTPVTAILARLHPPLSEVRSYAIGQHIVLPGIRVSSVRVEAADGRLVGRGRLGQTAGMRAVRIEPEPAPELTDPRPSEPAALRAP